MSTNENSKVKVKKNSIYLDLNNASSLGLVFLALTLFAVLGLMKLSVAVIYNKIDDITFLPGETFVTDENIKITASSVVYDEKSKDVKSRAHNDKEALTAGKLCAVVEVDAKSSDVDISSTGKDSAILWRFSSSGMGKERMYLSSFKDLAVEDNYIKRQYCWLSDSERNVYNLSTGDSDSVNVYDREVISSAKEKKSNISQSVIRKYRDMSKGSLFITYRGNALSGGDKISAQWKIVPESYKEK